MAHPGSPHYGRHRPLPDVIPTRHTQLQPDEARHLIPPRGRHCDAHDHRAGQQLNRGTSDEHHCSSQRRRRGPRAYPSVFSCGRRPASSPADASRHTRRHTGRGSSPARWCHSYARHGDGRKPPASCTTTRLPRRTIDTARSAPQGTIGRDGSSASLADRPRHATR